MMSKDSIASTTISELPWLRKKRPLRIAVVGDIMLDEYVEGTVTRISPEAPVPIHHVRSSYYTVGGAANVARNIRHLGGEALLFGVCGQDEGYRTLCQILADDQIASQHIIASLHRPTVKKSRIVANHHQIVRIDWEDRTAISDDEQNRLIANLEEVPFDVLVISDYAKGTLPQSFLSRLFKLGEEKKCPTIVDPKGTDFMRYKNATLITPNTKEACEALGLNIEETWDPEFLGKSLIKRFDLPQVLVTLGSKGLALVFNDERPSLFHPAVAREVFDVTGAGDTVVAVIALAHASQCDPGYMLKLANVAAGIVVEKWGAQPVYQEEFCEALSKDNGSIQSGKNKTATKIITREKARLVAQNLKAQGKTIAFTNGCFDLVHAGHVRYLEEASGTADVLFLGLNSSASVRRIKGPHRPIIDEDDRAKVLAALAFIDYVVIFDEETPLQLIEEIMPNILVKGEDWTEDKIVGAKEVIKSGGQVKRMPLVPGISTTEIIRRIKSQG